MILLNIFELLMNTITLLLLVVQWSAQSALDA